MSAATSIANDQEQARELLRREHKVRIVRPEEEGLVFDKLPAGVYGFTYAPATETPLFGRRSYQTFEYHKMADGSGRLLGYCTPKDAAKVRAGGEYFEIVLYPDPWSSATELVAVDMNWLVGDAYKPVRREGNALPLHLSQTPATTA